MKNNRRESDSVQLHFPFLHYHHHLQFYQRHSSPIYWVAIPNDFTLPDMGVHHTVPIG